MRGGVGAVNYLKSWRNFRPRETRVVRILMRCKALTANPTREDGVEERRGFRPSGSRGSRYRSEDESSGGGGPLRF